jgi:hypothetical protein
MIVKKHILKSGKKPVATNLYGNDAYMIHFHDSGQVWFKLALWFQRRRFLKNLQTDAK